MPLEHEIGAMSPQVWVAFAALMVTVLVVSGTGLWVLFSKLESNRTSLEQALLRNKDDLDNEIEAIRAAAYAEYKELRREMSDGIQRAYLEFGEAPKALREKMTQLELFMRDTYLPKRDYERAQDQIAEALKDFEKHLETRLGSFEKKLDKIADNRGVQQ